MRTQPIPVAPGVTEAATAHIRILVKQLELIAAQINEIKGHIHAIIEALSESDDTPDNDEMASSGSPRTWSDAAILSSLPGVGPVVLATLLSEASTRPACSGLSGPPLSVRRRPRYPPLRQNPSRRPAKSLPPGVW